eukprot:GHVO01049529.1.p1 GENE.GHVO01049529.1~~GHVO01049529.1.p1  ORF type:complete len:232 (+),score=50.36 GHVO01049529.1:3-698(+)
MRVNDDLFQTMLSLTTEGTKGCMLRYPRFQKERTIPVRPHMPYVTLEDQVVELDADPIIHRDQILETEQIFKAGQKLMDVIYEAENTIYEMVAIANFRATEHYRIGINIVRNTFKDIDDRFIALRKGDSSPVKVFNFIIRNNKEDGSHFVQLRCTYFSILQEVRERVFKMTLYNKWDDILEQDVRDLAEILKDKLEVLRRDPMEMYTGTGFDEEGDEESIALRLFGIDIPP